MNENLKVVTVTLNPAIDLTGTTDTVKIGKVNVLQTGCLHPAGKGINVAHVLSNLGANVTVTGFLGENNQQAFVDLFTDLNVTDKFIRVKGDTRINVKISETSGQMTDLNFPGILVDEKSIAELERCLFSLANNHGIFVIAGSLPQGFPPTRLASWIKKLQQCGKKVFFDSSHQALTEGTKSHPFLIKPNDDELSVLIDTPLCCDQEIHFAAKKLQSNGCENVVVSLGEKGVIWCDQQGVLKSTPPSVKVLSTVGAGDTLVAGLCWGEINNWKKEKTLSFATALSAMAVTQTLVGVTNFDALKHLEKEVLLS